MCTAITYKNNDFYFGRNLDLERTYNELVVITPRNYPLKFLNGVELTNHCAMIGMAAVIDDYPLYFEATNEKGLSMAALNFPGNAIYNNEIQELDNITPFELIPWLLGQCETVKQAKIFLNKLNVWEKPFSSALPNSPLHWILADNIECITIESTAKGLTVYNNPIGVLTNNPCFDYHLQNLSNYLNITSQYPQSRFSSKYAIIPYSLGMGALGLPGDPSSASRFVRAAFTKLNSVAEKTEEENVSQFFHILDSVEQQKGVTKLQNGELEYTMYSSCCNTTKGIYYYTTYYNRRINAVRMDSENLSGTTLLRYPLHKNQDVQFVN